MIPRMRMAATLVIGAAILVVAAALSSDSPEMDARTPVDVASLGPQVGEVVPSFVLPDQNGEMRTLESVLGSNGAMILFHRSADW